MKRITLVLIMVLLLCSQVWAASSMVVGTVLKYPSSNNPSMIVIPITCTAHTDGTFTTKQITNSEIGLSYSTQGYYLAHAWAVNSATDDHTNAAVVTITDASTQVIIGAASGDTLTLSQAASGVAYLSATRSAAQRAVTKLLSIAIADTGSTATVQTLYLVLVK